MSLKNVSTRNLYKIFRDIQLNHKELNDYGMGDIYRVNERQNLTHPTLWVDLFSADISHNMIVVGARIYVFDITDQSDFAEEDIQSDTLHMLNDVITVLRNHYELINHNFTVNSNFFKHSFNDRVAGWLVEVDLEVPTIYGECDMPLAGMTEFPIIEDGDPTTPPVSEFLLSSPSKLWRITINDDGNLQSQEVI